MRSRTRKLIGTILMLLLVLVYFPIAVEISSAWLIEASGPVQLLGYLFAGFACKAGVRCDAEHDASRLDAHCQCGPIGYRQHNSEMRHRHIVTVDRVCRFISTRRVVDDQLMPEEIEIDPVLARSAFGATERVTVEAPCRRQIIDRNRQMERP